MRPHHLLLYHGSDQVIETPAWNLGSRFRDFGQCFYMTHSEAMAKDWAQKRARANVPVVNRYMVDSCRLETGTLRIKRFQADAEWAEFVYNNRTNREFQRPAYDIIVGPLADRGLTNQFSLMKSEGLSFADVVSRIHYNRYRDLQVCFCSDAAVQLLIRID